jgi:septation ring formation regulator EzrA
MGTNTKTESELRRSVAREIGRTFSSTQNRLDGLKTKINETNEAIQQVETILTGMNAPDRQAKVALNVQARTLRLELARYKESYDGWTKAKEWQMRWLSRGALKERW